MGLHIIIFGNPVDGFTYAGPYTTCYEAFRAADDAGLSLESGDYWVAPLGSLGE